MQTEEVVRICAEIPYSRLLITLVAVLGVSRLSNAQYRFESFSEFCPESIGTIADIWQIGVGEFVIRSNASRPFSASPFHVSADGNSWKEIENKDLYGTFQRNPRIRASAVCSDSLVVVLLSDDSTSNRVVRIFSNGSTDELPCVPNFGRNTNTSIGDLVDINGTLVAIVHTLNDDVLQPNVKSSELFWLDAESTWRPLESSLAKSSRAGIFLQDDEIFAYAISQKNKSTAIEFIEANELHNLSTSDTVKIDLTGVSSLQGLGLANNNLCFLANAIDLGRSFVVCINSQTAKVQRFPLQPNSRIHYATIGDARKLLLVVSNTSLYFARISSEIEFQLVELEIEADGILATRTNIPLPDLPNMRAYISSARIISCGIRSPLVLYHRSIAWDQ